jgi:hypothetical protein
MISTAIDSPAAPVKRRPIRPDDSVRTHIWRLLSAMYPHVQRPERRSEERFPYPRLVYLRPVSADGLTPLGETLVVAGKHLSERGLGFYHPSPLAHRRVIATLERVEDDWLSFLLDINWCRFNRHGWYESGGRFLCPVSDVGPPE